MYIYTHNRYMRCHAVRMTVRKKVLSPSSPRKLRRQACHSMAPVGSSMSIVA